MEITDVKIRKKFDGEPLKAVASITFDNSFAVHDVKVINAKDRLFIVMPSRKNNDGTYRDVAHPINTEFRAEIEKAVLSAYESYSGDRAAEAFNTDYFDSSDKSPLI